MQGVEVGVLTFPNTNNYGAELQAFALCTAIRALGHAVELADYRNPTVARSETPRLPGPGELLRHPRGSLRRAASYLRLVERRRGFEGFRERCGLLGPRICTEDDLARRYGTVVVGSDQVWNPEITGGDATFLLAGACMRGVRKVAYAASFGYEEVPPAWGDLCGGALRDFDALSVREDAGAAIVRAISGRYAEVVLDPTLLLMRTQWQSVGAPRPVEGPYVFAYVVAERDKTLRCAREAAGRMGVPLVVVEGYGGGAPIVREGRDLLSASPEEFLALVRHAHLVVTSSFHGLALSLALGVEVRYALSDAPANKNSRLVTLARLAGVEDRAVGAADPGAGLDAEPIDYRAVDARLAAARERSLAFLATALSGGAR